MQVIRSVRQMRRAGGCCRLGIRAPPKWPLLPRAPRCSSSKPTAPPAKEMRLAKKQALCLAAGAGAGFCGSLVGLGGGFVIIPALTGLVRFTQHQAHGTSLVAVVATSATAAATYMSEGAVDVPAAAAMAAAGMLTAGIGAKFSSKLSAPVLSATMGAFMLCVAPTVPLKSLILEKFSGGGGGGSGGNGGGGNGGGGGCDADGAGSAVDAKPEAVAGAVLGLVSGSVAGGAAGAAAGTAAAGAAAAPAAGGVAAPAPAPEQAWTELLPLGLIGAVTGFTSGLFGVGGGSIMTPALALTTDFSQHTVVGTSLLAMLLPSAVGALSHARLGNVVGFAVLPVCVGTAGGAWLGSKAGLSLPEQELKWVFGVFMAVLGFRQLRSARRTMAVLKQQ